MLNLGPLAIVTCRMSLDQTTTRPVLPHVTSASNPTARIPLVIDSPHSGLPFPAEGRCIAPPDALLTSWDAYVDRLWSSAPEAGACLVAATFHRAFIDVNRDSSDIDPELLAEPWNGARPTVYSTRGMGLIRRFALPLVPMYDRFLSVEEVRARIACYYRPYDDALAAAIDDAHRRFGASWHINCHSMKSVGNAMNIDDGKARPDLVISDRAGTTADPSFTRWVASSWGDLGYRVTINDPYTGGDIVRRHGAPTRNRHSIQIEINRSLYMDQESFEPHEGIAKLEADIRTFLMRLRAHIGDLLPAASSSSSAS